MRGFLGGVWSYFERGELCGTTMRALVNKYPVDHLNPTVLFPPTPPLLSLRSAANFPVIWNKLFVKSMSMLPLGIHSQKVERGGGGGGIGWLDNSRENENNVWRIRLMTSSASFSQIFIQHHTDTDFFHSILR